jgi:hypothetical protein
MSPSGSCGHAAALADTGSSAGPADSCVHWALRSTIGYAASLTVMGDRFQKAR